MENNKMKTKRERQRILNQISQAMGLPSISVEFNAKLNAAAKAGEQDAIRREQDREQKRLGAE